MLKALRENLLFGNACLELIKACGENYNLSFSRGPNNKLGHVKRQMRPPPLVPPPLQIRSRILKKNGRTDQQTDKSFYGDAWT